MLLCFTKQKIRNVIHFLVMVQEYHYAYQLMSSSALKAVAKDEQGL